MSKFSSWVKKRVGNGPSVSGLKSSIKGTANLVKDALPLAAVAVPFLGPVASGLTSVLRSIPGGESVVGMVEKLGDGVEEAVSKLPGGQMLIDAVKAGKEDISKLGQFLVDNKESIVQAAAAVRQGERDAKSEALTERGLKTGEDALATAKQRYAEREPLRVAGMAGMLDPSKSAPDISALKAKANLPPLQVAMPKPFDTTNLQNAQRIAGNPPAGPLPMAPAVPTVNRPGFTPQPRPMTALAGRPATAQPLSAQPLPMAPQDMQRIPTPPGRKLMALPMAGDVPPNDPDNRLMREL